MEYNAKRVPISTDNRSRLGTEMARSKPTSVEADDHRPSTFPTEDQEERATAVTSANWTQLVAMNLVTMGNEVCTSSGYSYIPPLMLKVGFTASAVAYILGIGPFLSLLFVPFLGRWSDRHWGCLGRRRPFILGLSLLLLVSLLAIPYCHELGSFLTNGDTGVLVALGLGVVLFDFASQALFNPCKSMVSDSLQRRGFTVFTVMLNLGASIGYFLTSINWSETPLGRRLGGQEKAVFTLLFCVYFVFVVVCLTVAKETRQPRLVTDIKIVQKNGVRNGLQWIVERDEMPTRSLSSTSVQLLVLQKVIVRWCLRCKKLTKRAFLQVFSYFLIPNALFRLFLVDLFGWMAVHSHNGYYTDFVGQVIYKGKPQGDEQNLYDEGVRMGSFGLLLQCITAMIYAGFAQDWLVTKTGPQFTFLFGMTSFTLSMMGSVMASGVGAINVFSAISGIGLAAINTISCNLVTGYNMNGMDDKIRGMGEDMAVLDVASYLAQIVPFCFLGQLVRFYDSSSIYLIFSAFCGILSCLGAFFVVYPKTVVLNPT